MEKLAREDALITSGHWIFAGIFALAFVIFLIWSYRKDLKRYELFGLGGSRVLISIVVILLLVFIFRNVLI